MPIGFFSHTHKQETPETEWTIVHNLGTMAPAVDVIIEHEGEHHKMIPLYVRVVDKTTVLVGFTVPHTGVAAVR